MTTTCKLGQFVKSRRKELGWSQAEFAEALTKAGFPADGPRISRIENGRGNPKFTDLLIICRVLKCTPNDASGVHGAPLADVSQHIADATEKAIQALNDLKGMVGA